MRLLMLLLVFLAGYTATVAAQETDDAAIEINPLDYVPLAVGNRWTYEHVYQNYLDREEYPFDIPGYPPGGPARVPNICRKKQGPSRSRTRK